MQQVSKHSHWPAHQYGALALCCVAPS